MGEIVRLEHVDKAYQMGKTVVPVLKDINLVVEKGDYLSILGASGSGKSTLMNIIGCMDNADAGRYLLEDTDVLSCKDAQLTHLRNEKIGFVFQKYHLIPQYTILQNVILPLLIRGQSRKEAIRQAQDVIGMVGLENRVNHKPSELSGGQQQRVAIARALVAKPALLLADEPTGALDSHTGEDILRLFKELNDMGNTIIMITHDSNVAGYSEQMMFLMDGVFS